MCWGWWWRGGCLKPLCSAGSSTGKECGLYRESKVCGKYTVRSGGERTMICLQLQSVSFNEFKEGLKVKVIGRKRRVILRTYLWESIGCF